MNDIDSKSLEAFQEINQTIRKRNLAKIIDQRFSGSVNQFAKFVNKNKVFIYGLLWGVEKGASRKITDKTARLLECKLNLPTGFLDMDVIPDNICVSYISFVDIHLSEESHSIRLSSQTLALSDSEIQYFRLKSENLVVVRVLDKLINKFNIDDLVVIDTSRRELISSHVYFVNFNQKFIFREVRRNYLNGNNFISLHHSNAKSQNFSIVEATDYFEIIGTPVIKLGFLSI